MSKKSKKEKSTIQRVNKKGSKIMANVTTRVPEKEKITDEKDNQQPRKALGRGLSALIGTGPVETRALHRMVPIEKIKPNPTQPRKEFASEALEELTESIALRGVLQPLIVRRIDDHYEIVAGERRWRAAGKAGMQEVPVIVKEFTDQAALEVALIENIQRQDLDPLEESEAYQRLINDHGLTQEELARAMGKKRVTITNSLRLLKLPEELLERLADGRLTAGHARALMGCKSKELQLKLAKDVESRGLSVREVESKVRTILLGGKKITSLKSKDIEPITLNDRDLQERLQSKFGTRVTLERKVKGGEIVIQFHSDAQLHDLISQLCS